jgi:hypothetical protein
VADIGLQAVQRQDDTALAFQHPPQPPHPGQGRGQELVVAVEQIGHAPLGDVDPAIPQGGVDLGHTAVVAVAQHAHKGDDVQAELVLRQRERALRLRPEGNVEARTTRRLAAADPKAQPHRAGERHQMAAVLVAQPHVAAAARAILPDRGQHTLPLRSPPRR